MSSVQDHAPVVREPTERQPQDSRLQVSPSEPPQPATEVPRENSPPRLSQLLDPLPESAEPHPPRRGISTGTNSATLVNQPGTIGNQNGDTSLQDRSPPSDRRLQIAHDPIRGDITPVPPPLSDDGDHSRGSATRRVSVPRPRPIFNPVQDGSGNGNGNGSRVALRGPPGGDPYLPPQQPQEPPSKTVQERIQPTLDAAIHERDKCKKNARIQGILINGAIGLQVIVGAITTGVAAGSKNVGSAVAVLGGISTGLASYLAKARGSGEPESSNSRSRELSTFIREVKAFILDKGHKTGPEFDIQIQLYREEFELIIKTEGDNSTSGTGYAARLRGRHSPGFHPTPNQQQMGAMHHGGQYQNMQGGNGHLSEKQQMLKDEKLLSAMV